MVNRLTDTHFIGGVELQNWVPFLFLGKCSDWSCDVSDNMQLDMSRVRDNRVD